MPVEVDNLPTITDEQVQKCFGLLLAHIAKEHLNFETLETRRSDRLDFKDCAVWCVKDALKAAFMAGAEVGIGLALGKVKR